MLFCSVVLVGCSPSCESPKTTASTSSSANVTLDNLTHTPAAAKRQLVFLGDSLTAGYGLNQSQSFPALIQQQIDTIGLQWEVVNAGVSGDTTSGGVGRLDWLFKNKVDLLFVCLGANDGMRGVPVVEIEKNLRTIIERGQHEGATVVLAGMKLPVNYGAQYSKEFESIYLKLAKNYNLTFLPFLLDGIAFNPQFNQPDRIHPTAEGTVIVSKIVWETLQPLLANSSTFR